MAQIDTFGQTEEDRGGCEARLPGFFNHKYTPPHLVTIEYAAIERLHTPADFPTPVRVMAPVPPALALRPTLNLSLMDRTRRYLASVPPAIAGQHGDSHTFRVCCRLVRGFALDDADALALLTDWNRRCEPPWSERELRDKLRRARRYGRESVGGLLEGRACRTR